MGRGKIGLIRLWGLVSFTLVYVTPQALSYKEESKTCNPSHCGIITNISHPFRLRHDPPRCGFRGFELECKNNVTVLHLHSGTSNSTYQVLGINYGNYTIRLRDPGIREGDCSSLPRYFLSRSNFTDTYNHTYEYESNNPYLGSLGYLGQLSSPELTIDHVIYLKCSVPVRGDAGYVDTAPCVDWGSRGEEGGHVYAVVGDLLPDSLRPECRVKSVATIASYWRSFLKGESYSYADIHRILSHGFELSWWPLACIGLPCENGYCLFDHHTQDVVCRESEFDLPTCVALIGASLSLFCGMVVHLRSSVRAFLLGIFAGLPSKNIREAAEWVQSYIDSYYDHN